MGIIATNDRQITLIYDSSTKLGRECQAYAASSDKRLLTIDINKTKIASTEWAEIAQKLGLSVPELIATKHPAFTNIYGVDVDIDEESAFKILEKHPETVVYPIAIRGDRAIMAHIFTDILKLVDPDSGEVPIP
ncbi:arsenate reductase family protein [Robertkochia solimangrovi]|uniref:arsenate reductase family protein n=1 Tax=Robertkochia solimangrovi TaxID=2213046 RepID=UPI0011811259|nr:hypothetical protein [Robertkochia solimangrovi]TRZ45269.1 hypothetical protein DMZ48_05860 [Robertkochia solimangrovi]